MPLILIPYKIRPHNARFKNIRSSTGVGWASYWSTVWLDWVSIACFAALMSGIYFTPMYSFDQRLVSMQPLVSSKPNDPVLELRFPIELGFPWSKEPLSTTDCALVVIFVPILIIAFFQVRIKSIWDLHAGVVGVLKAVVATYVSECAITSWVGI